MPFEFRVLEAILLTLITHFAEGVQQCLREKQHISTGLAPLPRFFFAVGVDLRAAREQHQAVQPRCVLHKGACPRGRG